MTRSGSGSGCTRVSLSGWRAVPAGFTLVEILIVMMTVGVIVVIALPPMFATVRGTRLETAQQAFIGDLRLARLEAIRRNVSIAVRKTSATTYTVDSIGARTLGEGATFTTGPDSIKFAPFGPVPTGAATYTLHLNGRSATVRVHTGGNVSAQ